MSKAVFITGTGTDMGKTYLRTDRKKTGTGRKKSGLLQSCNEWK